MLVQAGGGNISFKTQSDLIIKASGQWFKNALEKDIFVTLDLNRSYQEFSKCADGKDDFNSCIVGDSDLRPSIETAMHLALKHNCVLHTHSIFSIMAGIRKDASFYIANKIAKRFCHAFIPYVRPGYELAKWVEKAAQSPSIDVFLLANHGVLIGGDNPSECYEKLLMIEAILSQAKRKIAILAKPSIVFPNYDFVEEYSQIAFCDDAIKIVQKQILPDQIVFIDEIAVFISLSEAQECVCKAGKMPCAFVIKGQGVWANSKNSLACSENLFAIFEIALRTQKGVAIKELPVSEIAFFRNWQAEIYRRKFRNG